MNAVAAKRSVRIKALVKQGVDFDCTYDGQINTHMGRLLSVMFNGDHMADHAFFLMLLNKDWTTADSLLRFFRGNEDLLEYMVHWYQCDELRQDIFIKRRLLS